MKMKLTARAAHVKTLRAALQTLAEADAHRRKAVARYQTALAEAVEAKGRLVAFDGGNSDAESAVVATLRAQATTVNTNQ
jgi:hypothetical protein